MSRTKGLFSSVAAIAIAAFLAGAPARLDAQQAAPVSIGATDLGGLVSGPNGPEAGVWVLRRRPTFHQDGQDRGHRRPGPLLLPELPKPNTACGLRGYGLSTPQGRDRAGRLELPRCRHRMKRPPPSSIRHLLAFDGPRCPRKVSSLVPVTAAMASTRASTRRSSARVQTDGCFHCHARRRQADAHYSGALGKFSNGI